MATSLTGLTPATTYDALIKVGDNGPIDGTLKTLSDGLGNDLPMEASTTAVNFTNQLQQSGVAVPTASQVAAKQDTLVSGTNIKTINGTSVLGSGNIVTPTTNPSGVAGAIQFSNGSAFASDASNFFWDDANNRLGVGTNAPTQALEIAGGSILLSNAQSLKWRNSSGTAFDILRLFSDNSTYLDGVNDVNIRPNNGATNAIVVKASGNIGISELSPSARVHIKGSGSTSATTSLLVQNSAGTAAMNVRDNLSVVFGGEISSTSGQSFIFNGAFYNNSNDRNTFGGAIAVATFACIGANRNAEASSVLELVSTTRGFLPPKMTTTQKNNISSPASGLVVYDNTTNKLCCYNGSTWNDLF